MGWESTFQSWAAPPGVSEQTKCDNAVTAIQKAIEASDALSERNISVFAQGSYRNRTNVRIESDVDVCVLCTDTMFFNLPGGREPGDLGIVTPAPYQYRRYKDEIASALASYFGRSDVAQGNKAFDVHANSYRVDADVVACFEYRRYWNDSSYRVGTAFQPDGGGRVVNYPKQNYENGVAKNDATGRRFKSLVRILKRLRYVMEEAHISSAKPIASYLIECLVWNAPDEAFGHETYTADVRWVLAHLFNETRNAEDCEQWCEVNSFKYLFHPSQPWTLTQAHAFVSDAWDYIGFK